MKVNFETAHRFFLGANTPNGFVSRMDQLTDPAVFDRVILLKGGPGSGKSTLLTRVAKAAAQAGHSPELICCSFDFGSLDAVSFGKTAIVDGSLPHALEPQYPGALETLVSLGECWDEAMIAAHREEIIGLTAQKRRLCEQSSRYLAAAWALLSGSYRLALEATDTGKIERLACRIAAAEFRGGAPRPGTERVRLLSALTSDGQMLLNDTALALAGRIYLLEDEHGPSAALLLAALRRLALEAGHDLICCTSPLAPYERLEHLFIPALSLGFMTKNDRLCPEVIPCRVINSRRFTDKTALAARKKRISFNKKAARQMIAQAQALLGEAGEAHRRLEEIYTPAMDFAAVDALTERLLSRLLG